MENLNSSLEKYILEELSCPACFNHMNPPIRQCMEGHNICNDCFKLIVICPTCRGQKSETSRNYALEGIFRLINIPCKHQDLGCNYSAIGTKIEEHQMYCWYTKNKCPMSSYDNCGWEDTMHNLYSHLKKQHPTNFYQKDRQKFVSNNFKNIKGYHYIFAILHVFQVYFRLTWEIKHTTGMTRWAVYYIGSPEDAKNYAYRIEINKSVDPLYTPVPLTFKSECVSKPKKEKFRGHNCFYIHKSLLDSYCTSNGDLHYRVSLYSLKDDQTSSSSIYSTIEVKKDEITPKMNELTVIEEETGYYSNDSFYSFSKRRNH